MCICTDIYIIESGSNAVRVVSTTPAPTPAPVVGAPVLPPGSFTNGAVEGIIYSLSPPKTSKGLLNPQGIAMDSLGNIFIADTGNHIVWKIEADSQVWSIVAGSQGNSGNTGDNGKASNALLNSPWGVATDSWGNLYIADTGNNITRIVTNSGYIYTIISSWIEKGVSKSLRSPIAIATDTEGAVYVGDTNNFRIIKTYLSCGKEGYYPVPITRRCYKFVSTSVSWFQARSNCAADGAKLATISSEELSMQGKTLPSSAWIGYNDADSNSVYQWDRNETVSYVKCAYCNLYAGKCAVLNSFDGSWYPEDCNSATYPYICETGS